LLSAATESIEHSDAAAETAADPGPDNRQGARDREPLSPGRPMAMLGWLRGSRSEKRVSAWVLVVPSIIVTLALGTWGFRELRVPHQLSLLQSFYRAVRLYALDLGPAAGSSTTRPNWQLWVALLFAAGLVFSAVFALARDRLRRGATGHLLRGHEIVCGGGVHGTELVEALSGGRPYQRSRSDATSDQPIDPDRPSHDVVLVDIDPRAPGMQAPRGKYEWRIVGDCVLEQTLLTAGAAHANWIVAITGKDYVNSQIASTVHTLVKERKAKDRVHVLVQVEDPSLTRFLEEDTELARREAGQSETQQLAVVSPFSANTIAAEALLDSALCQDGSPLLEMHGANAPNILLAGDHPLIEALVLGAVRRWHEQMLRDLESGTGKRQAGDDAKRSPIHISVFGPDAVGRVERLQHRWRPEASVAAIEATDGQLADEAAYEWLREEGRADHAFIACLEELEGVKLTLGVSRALGAEVVMTRVTAQPGNVLDDRVRFHTERSPHMATTKVRQLTELASDPRALHSLAASQRLEEALARDMPAVPEQRTAEEASAEHPRDKQPTPKQLSDELFGRPEIEMHSDSSWRIPECERELLRPLVAPVPLSALVRARLVVDLSAPETLRAVAEKLSETDPAELGFTAWCLYARQQEAGPLRALLGEADTPPDGVEAVLVEAEEGSKAEIANGRLPRDEIARDVLRLRIDAIDHRLRKHAIDHRVSAPRGPLAAVNQKRVAILAGGADGMSDLTARAARALLQEALVGYDGIILSGGTGSGLPGIVADVAGPLGICRVGYVPEGRGDERRYPLLRETLGVKEFSVREPIQMWTDIVKGQIPAQSVRVLALPGGAITLREILLARAMGASVAWLDPAREEDEALEDQLPLGADGVLDLPVDAMTVRAFLMPSRLESDEYELLETVAKNNHSAYLRDHRKRKSPGDPAMAPWNDMVFTLKRSGIAQVHDIPNKLALVGKQLANPGKPLVLSEHEIELLARVEHGRWNVERLSSGWKLGPRDIARKTTPYLVPWADLDSATQDYDREAVRNIGPALAAAGRGVEDLPTRRRIWRR
jgi:voltage-gated potassium channel Kch